MAERVRTPGRQWTHRGAVLLAAACLAAGVAGGWWIRASRAPTVNAAESATSAPPRSALWASPAARLSSAALPDPGQMKQMADAQAAPLLDQLRSDPKNADLLTRIGNLYYDARQYPIAADYYRRVLEVRPSDAAVRTDMGTAYWLMGNADAAISEFRKALGYAPDNANTLFNLGLVEWRGKVDAPSAISDWERLLAASPNYKNRDTVEQMIAQAKASAAQGAKVK
jgi:tetratricopeptide (TPR) repeat protein